MNQHLEQMQQTKRVIAVSILCMVVLLWYNTGNEHSVKQDLEKKNIEKTAENLSNLEKNITAKPKFETREEAVKVMQNENHIVNFENSDIAGFVNLNGAKIENLVLKNHKADGDKSQNIALLSPSSAREYYYIDFGWMAQNGTGSTPNSNSTWTKKTGSADKFSLYTKIREHEFYIDFVLSEKYLWKVSMRSSGKFAESFKPYIRIKRSMEGKKSATSYSHEGISFVKNGVLDEVKYSNISNTVSNEMDYGWVGFADKYWFAGVISKDDGFKKTVTYRKSENCSECYQIDIIKSGDDGDFNVMLYTGAKELGEITKYEKDYNIKLFDRVIDFGWFYFLTKPLLSFIKILYNLSGNFGVAIILLTIIIRIALFPLANKSYKSMAKLKTVAPQLNELKERCKNDKKAFNMAVIELYKREKVNPAAGCLPLLLQIPVFFALYKVLIVSIEMRDAPFIGWLLDLSEPDPTSIFNAFGLLPYSVPSFLQIGILPIIMGITMHLQQKLSPAPSDPNQARVMKLLPFIFTFLFAGFPSGLVLYWSVNNTLSILQQYYVTKKSTQAK